MREVGEKRKYPVEKKVVIFVNSALGEKCAALYEFNFQTTKTVSGDVCELETEADSGNDVFLDPIACFYDQRQDSEIESVAACVLNNSIVYVMADDLEPDQVYFPDQFFRNKKYLEIICAPRDMLPVFTFDLKTHQKQTLLTPPKARKPGPILAVVNNNNNNNNNNNTCVFALSAYALPFYKVQDPCFESLDLTNNKWRSLACHPFHVPYDKTVKAHEKPFYVLGHAVLLDKENGYVIVSLTKQGLKATKFYSYNIGSGDWKPTLLHRPGVVVSDDLDAPRIRGEAVVIGDNIYTYNHRELYVFAYARLDDQTHDLALGAATLVQGLELKEECVDTDWDVPYTFSCAVAKVDDDTLCVFHTLVPTCLDIQCVSVTFIQLKGRELCNTLKAFTCKLSTGLDLVNPTIKACFVLNPDETSDHGKRAAM